jgi:pimeloyl-ACP methyl ester carboxylesterase
MSAAAAQPDPAPAPPGRFADLGSHRLHVHCTGAGSPTVVVENGLGDFSFDWSIVQSKVQQFTRICTYDRAGYAWSDPGPKPRTFAQLNLELHDALAALGETAPFVLVGHSFGGPVVRSFAARYPSQTAGIVLVDSAFEGMRVGIGGGKTMKLGEDAKGRAIPEPREEMRASDKPAIPAAGGPPHPTDLPPMYRVLSADDQKRQLWAQFLPQLDDAESSQREWSSETFGAWLKTPQAGTLGTLPLIVLTRAQGGFRDADVTAAQMEQERLDGQAKLAALSSNGRQIVVKSGHNMELEAPDEVTSAIRLVVEAVRHGTKIGA